MQTCVLMCGSAHGISIGVHSIQVPHFNMQYTMNTTTKCVVVRALVHMSEWSRVLVCDGAYVCAL